jgi:hypothetical protein
MHTNAAYISDLSEQLSHLAQKDGLPELAMLLTVASRCANKSAFNGNQARQSSSNIRSDLGPDHHGRERQSS